LLDHTLLMIYLFFALILTASALSLRSFGKNRLCR